MAYQYNYKFWLATAEELQDMMLKRKVFETFKNVQDKHEAHDLFALIYSRYVGLVNRLSYLFDVTLQVQKRELIQRLLEAATNRLLEVRNELKQIELSEYVYLDNVLIKQKMLLDDVQLLRPFYFPMARDSHVQDLIDNKVPKKLDPMDDEISQVSLLPAGKSVKRRMSKARIHRKSSVMSHMAQTDPVKYNRMKASTLIKIHDKARRARVFLTNIRYHPEQYRPQAPDIGKGFYYEFTHKPEQAMLILVKRTHYDSNYFVERQISENIDFYVRPVHRKLKLKEPTAKRSSSSIETSLNDDYIQFEGGFEDEGDDDNVIASMSSTRGLGRRTMSGSRVSSYLSTDDLREKIMNAASFNEISQLAQTFHLMEDMRESREDNLNTVMTVSNTRVPPKDDSKNQHRRTMDIDISKNAVGSSTSAQVIRNDLMQASLVIESKGARRSYQGVNKSRSHLGSSQYNGPYLLDVFGNEKTEKDQLSRKSTQSQITAEGSDKQDEQSMITLLNKRLRNSAARVIQAAWKRHLLNKRLKRRRLEKLILYGMVSEWKWNQNLDKELEEDRIKRRNKKALFDRQFIEACENEKTRIVKVRGPWIMEDISEHIRAWFREFYDGVGEFDRYPEEFEGGTILVIRGETMTVQEYREAKEAKKNQKKKTPEEKKKEKEKRKAEREKLKEQKRKEKQLVKLQKLLEAKMGKTYDFSKESPYLTQVKEVMEEYNTKWDNIDEKNNVNEDPYMEWISLDKFAEAHQELRLVVDELMRVEFDLLRKALAEDKKKKYKPQKKKKQKKGKRGKGKKQPKDLTADRTVDSLYQEFADYGLITKFSPTTLDEYVGEYNYSAYEKRLVYQMDPPPGQGEIKDLIREAIHGMGPLHLPKVKSLCLAGPARSGKKYLVQAIVTELGATVFDISSEKIARFENDMKYFLHLINKMARILQPTVLLINGCERIFWKKVPKEDADLKPRLLGKYIIKQIVKPIKKEDKVLVLGITDEPFKAKLGKMKKCFEKTIIVPRADYGTTFQLHRSVALKKFGVPRDFDFSAVSMVSSGFASSVIYDNLNSTLGIERRMKLMRKPLQAPELIEGFLSSDEPQFPITDEDYQKYTKFYTQVDKLAKQRAKFMKEQEKLKAKEKPKGKK